MLMVIMFPQKLWKFILGITQILALKAYYVHKNARTGILSADTTVSGIICTRISILIRICSIRTYCVRPCHIG